MVVQHNIGGMNANRQLNITTGVQGKSSEKLSSGYRINRAADDAAGLAISEKMRRQIRGLTQASNNAQDGISWCQIADGALDEVSNMVSRAKELAVQAANDPLTDDDRKYINDEMQKMAAEIDRVHASTEFNNINIFSDAGYDPQEAFQTSPNGNVKFTLPTGQEVEITVEYTNEQGEKVNIATDGIQDTGTATGYGNSEFATFIKNAAANAIQKLSNTYNDLFAAAATSGIKIGLNLSNIDGSGGTLAQATLKMSASSTNSVMSYQMTVDSTDYNINNYSSMTPAQKSDLAAVIAHEMTHLVMYDTLTNGMLGDFPKWFKEGVAQASSGDNDWVSYELNASSSEADIKNYISQIDSMPYGAGYVASMYLGYIVTQKTGTPTGDLKTDIAEGLDKLMTDIAKNGKTLSQAIADNTNNYYSSQSAFEGAFRNKSADVVSFTQTLLGARGANGAGSLLADSLNQSEEAAFNNANSGGSYGSFAIDPNTTWYSHGYGTGFTFPAKGSLDDPLGKVLYLQVGSETKDLMRSQ
jgi:flagellin